MWGSPCLLFRYGILLEMLADPQLVTIAMAFKNMEFPLQRDLSVVLYHGLANIYMTNTEAWPSLSFFFSLFV